MKARPATTIKQELFIKPLTAIAIRLTERTHELYEQKVCFCEDTWQILRNMETSKVAAEFVVAREWLAEGLYFAAASSFERLPVISDWFSRLFLHVDWDRVAAEMLFQHFELREKTIPCAE